ncbi:uncharacterized protein LOC123655811 [Melitaea cinxia]|uniref:uncharacterized protein LOC123655811 n=1 Tax=Melitaea cinxia TaxID=113334 RepID=UPI001E2742D5|nr:uncharacterized protein LOC123655811 [Melitaea cinxia]
MSEEYYLQPPSEQLFYRFMANMMSFFCAGDRATWGFGKNTKLQSINRMILFIFGPIVFLSQILYLYVNYSDLTFDILGILFSIIPVTFLANVNIFSSKFKSYEQNLSDEKVRVYFKKIIEYNTFILDVFKDVQDAFGLNVSANYLQNLFGNSVVMYQLMYGGRENMAIYIAMVMTYTGGPIIMSIVLEEIRRQTYDLSSIVYNIPWEKMSVSNQKIILLILQRSQILMDFKAFGGMKAGVGTMLSILKTTFSYYIMLKSSIGNET